MRTLLSYIISETKNVERRGEEDVPTTPKKTNKCAWFSRENGDKEGEKRASAQASERAAAAHGK